MTQLRGVEIYSLFLNRQDTYISITACMHISKLMTLRCFEIVTSSIRSATSLPQVAKSWGGDVVGSNKNNKKWRYLLIERSRAENIGGEINKVRQALQVKTSYASVNNTEPDRRGTSAYDIMFVFHGLTMVGWWRWWTCVVVSSFIFHGLFSVEQVMNKIALAEGGSITWICGMMLGLP